MNPKTTDVAIIGGGIIGFAVAYEAAKRGLSVTVLERDEPGSGATGAGGGFISIASKKPGPHMDMARVSAKLYETLEEELETLKGFLGYKRDGGLILAEVEDRLPLLEEFVQSRKAAGLALETLTPHALYEMEPNLARDLAGAVYCPTDGEAIPLRVLQAYRAAGERRGVRFLVQTTITGARRTGETWDLETTAGNVNAAQVVLAAGAWSAQIGALFGIKVPLRPRRGQGILVQSGEKLLHHPMLSVGYFDAKYGPKSEEATVELSLWQRADGAVFVGGTREWAEFDSSPDPRLLAEVRRRGERVLPKLKAHGFGQPVVGFRPYSETGLPLLGPVPRVPSLHLATGHEGDGVSLAPITGRLLAQALSGETPEMDLSPYRIEA
jgi:sarcosine oxidase subunit beta